MYIVQILLHSMNPAFTLTDMDSVSCLFNLSDNGRTAILNYASYKSPGGFFLEGSPAQEEALCHESNLYPILLAFDGTYYAWNRQRLNKALYLRGPEFPNGAQIPECE